MHSDEGTHSSEEGSGNHSPPDFVAPFSSIHGDNFRYHQHDSLGVQRATAPIEFQPYDYPTTISRPSILLDAPQELSNSTPPFSSHYPLHLPHRNQIDREFLTQHQLHSRSPPHHGHISNPIDLRYTSSPEGRLPGNHVSHEFAYSRQDVNPPIEPRPVDHPSSPEPRLTEEHESPTSSTATASAVRPPRKEVSTVVIACRQCRARKIRCDSTRPICNNCIRRSNVCEYDTVPKRRGPDKRPGTRQRSCKKRPTEPPTAPPPKRRRTTHTDGSQSPNLPSSGPSTLTSKKENLPRDRRSSPFSPRYQDQGTAIGSQGHVRHGEESFSLSPQSLSPILLEESTSSARHFPYIYDSPRYTKSSYLRPSLDINIMRSKDIPHHKFPPPPPGKHDQNLWWDQFLASHTVTEVEQELRYLAKDTGHCLSFLNVEFIVKRLYNEEQRLLIQPAFIYAILAMATLMKSSEMEYRAPGRERALWLRNTAQSHLETSWKKDWVDATLAEAALILALYETSAHELYSPERAESALVLLDDIISRINLTLLDQHDRGVCNFPVGCVPVVHLEPMKEEEVDKKCSCIPSDAAHPPDLYTSWSYALPWDPTWSDAQVRDEECRRLCWSALSLVCNYVSQCVAFDRDPPNFFLTDAGNYALLFPGEALDRVSPNYRATNSMSTKESIWALYCRSMLLWTCTNRMRAKLSNTDEQVDMIYDAWSEAQSLQDSLRMHDCNLDTRLIYLCREYIFNTRISITYALRSLQGFTNGSPMFKRKHAEDWLWYQDRVIQLVKTTINHLGTTQGRELTRRPQQVTWFIGQLSICLLLWNYDHTLKNALILGKSLLYVVEVMNSLWPCHLLQRQCRDLQERLVLACTSVGIEPPQPSSHILPFAS